MFMIVGHRQRTEGFDGARKEARRCGACAAQQVHHEKRVVHAATAFFVPVANVRTEYEWVCSGCHGRQASDRDAQWAGEQGGTLAGSVAGALGSAAEVATPAVAAAVTGASHAVRTTELPSKGWRAVQGLWNAAQEVSRGENADKVEDAEEIDR